MPRIVLPTGPENASILLVGEAPGRQEDEFGIPFYEGRTHYGGPTAGALLTQWLHAVGIKRSDCRLTNVILERPPGNRIEKFIDLSQTAPISQEGYSYIEKLKDEIKRCNPNIIVAFGRVPMWILTGESELGGPKGKTRFRGSILPCTLVSDYKVLCTYHPASAMEGRSWLNRYWIMADLKKARRYANKSGPITDHRKYILYPTFDECIEYLNACKEAEFFAFDAELHHGEIPCESFSCSPEHVLCIPFMNEDGTEYFTLEEEAAIWLKITEILESDTLTLAFNAGFDTFLHLYKYGIKPRNVHCCRLMMAIAYADLFLSGEGGSARGVALGQKQKELAAFTALFTDIPFYKDESKYKMKYGTGERYLRYCALDSIALVEGYPRIRRVLQRQGNWDSFLRQQRLDSPFNYNGLRGIRINANKVDTIGTKLENDLFSLETEIQKLVGYDINPSSPPQLMDYFYDVCGAYEYKNRKTGKRTVNNEALLRLCRQKDPKVSKVATLLVKFKHKEQLATNFFGVTLSETGRLHTMMDDAGTRFGRPSSGRNRVLRMGANFQNQPPEFKRLMLPDKGFVLYKVDGAQAENRVVAYIANDTAMIHAFDSGLSLHAFVASRLFGGPPEKDYQNSQFPKQGGGRLSAYELGKRTGHASNYLESYKSIALRNNISETAGKRVQRAYFGAFPAIPQWHKKVEAQLKRNGTIVNLFGRRYRFYSQFKNCLTQAVAFCPQSTVGELTNQTFCDIYYDQETFGPVEILLIEHDGLYFQMPKNIGWTEHERILTEIRALMERPLHATYHTFHIPAEITMLPFNFDSKNPKTALELEDISSGNLEAVYKEAFQQRKLAVAK